MGERRSVPTLAPAPERPWPRRLKTKWFQERTDRNLKPTLLSVNGLAQVPLAGVEPQVVRQMAAPAQTRTPITHRGSESLLQCGLHFRTQTSAFSGFMLRTFQARSAARLRQSASRVNQSRTSPARPARPRYPSQVACACALRCFKRTSKGSIRASRARDCASSRSFSWRISPISRALRASATITSCPKSLSKRLIRGECVPLSIANRLRGAREGGSESSRFFCFIVEQGSSLPVAEWPLSPCLHSHWKRC